MTGNDILAYFYLNEQGGLWVPFGCCKTNEIQVDSEMIEISSPTTGKWKEYIEGRSGWVLNINYLVLNNSQIRDVLKNGQKFKVCFCPRNAQASGVTGYAYLRSCHTTATRGLLIQGTYQFQGTGELQ